MIKLKIDDRDVEVEDGATVLDAATSLGIAIPTMCFRTDCRPSSSCMVCVVKDERRGRMIPACAARAVDGMVISTGTDEVTTSRRTALELLLSDHIGDCDAPCHRVCPAGINIPVMIRHVMNGDFNEAARTVVKSAGSNGNPCDNCKCPCEKACRRARYDSAVSIRLLVAFSLDFHKNGPREAAPAGDKQKRFNCNIGRLIEGEMEEFLKYASPAPRVEPAAACFTEEEARNESARCLHCDCRKQDSCLLRRYSDDYSAAQRHYAGTERKPFTQVRQHANVIYEPGKCIKCGLCVQITEKESEPLGLSFIGRGFDVRIGVPFDRGMEAALKKTAEQCVAACPTAALSSEE